MGSVTNHSLLWTLNEYTSNGFEEEEVSMRITGVVDVKSSKMMAFLYRKGTHEQSSSHAISPPTSKNAATKAEHNDDGRDAWQTIGVSGESHVVGNSDVTADVHHYVDGIKHPA